MIEDLKEFYGGHFSNGAKDLELFKGDIRGKDATRIAFWLGMSLVMMCFGFFFLIMPSSDGTSDYSSLISSV